MGKLGRVVGGAFHRVTFHLFHGSERCRVHAEQEASLVAVVWNRSILAVACVWTVFGSRGVPLRDRVKAGGVLCGLLLAGLHLKPMIKGR